MELDTELRQELIKLIKKGKPIPISYKSLLFPLEEKPREIELVYGRKERKEDILTDTWSVPFQAVKQFGNVREDEWYNMLIFGDNLQALKFMLNNPEMLERIRKTGGVKLIYIDPPFGTGKLYDVAGVPAYYAALRGAEFVEFLRKRLILLRELLADDGSIYIRIDYHFGHYVKVIIDEIFGKNNFQNEIVVNRTRTLKGESGRFHTATDSIYFYAFKNHIFHGFRKLKEHPEWVRMHLPGVVQKNPERIFFGKRLKPPKGRKWVLSQKAIENAMTQGLIEWDGKLKEPLFLTKWKILGSNWTDIPGYSKHWKYPTENSEQLLERIIKASSNPGDIVLDAFAGSGTTGAVVEKLGRKWIMVDSSKLAIYTMIKRMFNLKQKIGNKAKRLRPKPFILYNAGLYKDHGFILSVGEDQYKKFAMELFQVEPKKFEINGLEMDGVLFNCPVKVFSQKGYLTEDYVDELHNTVGEQLKWRMFIIAPASRVYFLQDYIEKDGVRYYVLRIPYSVIDELHKRAFTRPMQPASSAEINQIIEQVGFDFIHPPEVKCEYYRAKEGSLFEQLIIKIEKFEAVQRSKEPIEFEDPKEALSMVLVDKNYNGEYFNMSDYFFKDQIERDGWKVKIPTTNTGKKIMIIYLDILGNERVEVKSINEFKRK